MSGVNLEMWNPLAYCMLFKDDLDETEIETINLIIQEFSHVD